MASIGSVVIDLLLKTGSFETDTQRAQKSLKGLEKQAYDTGKALGDSIRNLAAAAGVTLSVAAFTNLIKGSIDAADHLNDLSKKTGVAVETLGGIGFAAQQAGSDLESSAAAIGKLNKTIAEAAAGKAEAIEPFQLLGVAIKDAAGQSRSADAVFAELADKFASYADGPEKSALALRLFGKAGADIIPLLDDGGAKLRENIAYYQKYSGVTTEVANRADQFNDTLTKLNLLQGAFGREMASALLPTLQRLADAFVESKEKGDGFKSVAQGIADVFDFLVKGAANVVFVFGGVGREIGAIAAQIAALARGDFKGFSAISDAVKEDGVKARAELDRFLASVGKSAQGAAPAQPEAAKPAAPRLSDKGSSDSALAELKKRLDGQLKLIAQFAQEQKAGYDFANRYVEGAYDAGLASLQESIAAQKRVRDAGLAAELKALDDEIAARRAYASSKLLKPEDRIEAENRIAEAIEKRAAAVKKAGADQILVEQANARALKQVRDEYDALRATVLELEGDQTAAAKIRIAQQVEAARLVARQSGGDPGIADRLQRDLERQDKLRQAQEDYNVLLSRSSALEDQFRLRAELSGAGLKETEQGIYQLRSASLVQLGELRDRYAALAETSTDPRIKQAALEVQVAYEKAAANVDPALNRLREGVASLSQSIASDIGDAIVNFQGLGSVIRAVEKDILSIGTKILVTEPLEQGIRGVLKGVTEGDNPVGGFLKDVLGIGGGQGSTASATASLTTFTSVGVAPATVALGTFTAALSAASAAAGGASALPSASDLLDGGSFFSSFAGLFANGGSIGSNQWGIVGEKGAELVRGPATVEPLMSPYRSAPQATQNRNRPLTVNNTFALYAPADRRTQDQIAQQSTRSLIRAQRNN